ncbi:MAG TPA: hypothetical protein VI700_04975 [Thermoanaerobaculaceae bacterium]|nr:hypothetical protein [Thermoanaerobaculaceae bacterium]
MVMQVFGEAPTEQGQELKPGPVLQRVALLERALEELEGRTGAVVRRLLPVLREEPGIEPRTNVKGGGPPVPNLSRLAERLDSLHIRVANLTAAFGELLDRIEL